MEQTIKDIKFSYKNFLLRCQLLSSSLLIEVNDPSETEYYYYLVITNDSLPEDIKILFENYQEIYEYLTDLSIPERFQIEEPKVLRLLVKVGKNVKKVPIHLIAKQMTKEMILEKKVQTLEKQNHQLRQELKMHRLTNSSLQPQTTQCQNISKDTYSKLISQIEQLKTYKKRDVPLLDWSKIGSIQPEQEHLNLIVKVLSVKCGGKNKKKLVLGDETGIVSALMFANQELKQGDTVMIHKARAQVKSQHIILHLMNKGTIQVAIDQSKGINKEFDVSKKEWVPI